MVRGLEFRVRGFGFKCLEVEVFLGVSLGA